MARLSNLKHHEPRASSRSPTGVEGPKDLSYPLLVSQAIIYFSVIREVDPK